MSDNDNQKQVFRTLLGTAAFVGLSRRFGVLNTLFYSALAIFTILVLAIFIMGQIENSDYDISWEKVKAGDSLFYQHDTQDTASGGFNPQILIRPLNKADIEAMKIEAWKKNKMINEIDSTLTPQLVSSKYRYNTDSMYKYGTGFIGTFIKKDTLKELGVKDGYGNYWYTFKPNKLHTECCYIEDIPKGYILADKKYMYVPAGWVRLVEQVAFVPSKTKKALSAAQKNPLPAKPLENAKPHKKKILKKHLHKSINRNYK